MANNELSYILKLKDDASKVLGKFNKEIGSTGNSISSFAKSSSKLILGMTAAATAAAAGLSAIGLKIAGDMEMAEQGLKAILGSTEKAAATMERIKKEAAATPFELPGLIKGTQALAAITKDGNKAIDILMDVGKAVAISGKGQAELDRVIINLQQIAATGKVTAMDIRQFQGAIPIFNDILAASGLTAQSLQDSSNAAELLFKAFEKAGKEGGIAAEGFSSQAGTLNQLISNLKDSFGILAAEVVKESGIMDMAKAGIEALINFLNNHQQDIVNFVTAFVNGIRWMAQKAIDLKNVIEQSINLIKTKFEEFKSGIESLKNDVTNKFGETADFVGGKIEELNKWYDDHREEIKKVAGVLLFIFGPALVKTGIQATVTGAKIATKLIVNLIKTGVQAGISATIGISKFITSLIRMGVQAVITGGKMAVQLVSQIIRVGIQAGITAGTGLLNLIIATSQYSIAGWKAFFSIVAQITQLTIYYGAMIVGAVATWAMTAAIWAFNAALVILTSPITLIILALIALAATIYLVIKNWDLIKQKTIEIWSSIKEWLIQTWESIKEKVNEAWQSMLDNISQFLELTKQKIIEIWNNIKNWLSTIWNSIKTEVTNTWNQIKVNIITTLKNTWVKIINTLSNWKSKLGEWGRNIGGSFVDGFKNALFRIVDGIKEALNRAKDFLKGNSPPAKGAFKNIDQWGFNVGDAWTKGFIEAISRVPNELSGHGGTIGNNTTNNNNTINVDATINTPMDAEELAIILGRQLATSGAY